MDLSLIPDLGLDKPRRWTCPYPTCRRVKTLPLYRLLQNKKCLPFQETESHVRSGTSPLPHPTLHPGLVSGVRLRTEFRAYGLPNLSTYSQDPGIRILHVGFCMLA